jgi:predicted nucleic acid-binding protein
MSVVDASVWVSRLVPQDEHHAQSRDWLEQQTTNGQLLVAPVLLLAEVAGAVTRRTGRMELGRRTIETILRVPGLRLVTLDGRLGLEAARLAAELRLRGADAVYVAVAHRLNLSLVTWDEEQRLRGAAKIVVRTP